MAGWFSRFSPSVLRAGGLKHSLKRSYGMLAGVFSGDDREEERQKAVLALVRTMLAEDGEISGARLEIVRELIEEQRGMEESNRQIRLLREVAETTPEKAASDLGAMSREDLCKLLRFLVLLALLCDVMNDRSRGLLGDFACRAGLPEEEFFSLLAAVEAERKAHDELIRSGAGIVAALIVIGVFILTATLLRSVIFGLIGAYLLLPLEKFFEGRIRRRRGIVFALVSLFEGLFLPLNRLRQAVSRRPGQEAAADPRSVSDRRITRQAISVTVLLVAIVFLGVLSGASALTGRYVARTHRTIDVRRKADSSLPSARPAETKNRYLLRIEEHLERIKDRFSRYPAVRRGVELIRESLRDDKTRNEVIRIVLRSTGGVVNFTASVVGTVISIVGDIVLSVFFGLLFLFKLAEFCRTDSSSGRQSEYLVRTVFNGKWLPGADENTVADARIILSGTFSRLRIWVRGYLLLMLTDTIVYTTMFFLLGLPYFPVLGLIAGCGILLPYIGPVLGCLVALLTTIAIGDASGVQILGLLVFYLIYSGVVEQFILYPAVIGESLGLTTLETIIVVLLGAVFAGISGMIFALPAASVIKYIVPQIYRRWKTLPSGLERRS
ncbi:MAG: AI-2E family transporter [Lentisphaeria bacterium]|nr:AI-2E family transporter [Lentisphaeria bacterium]